MGSACELVREASAVTDPQELPAGADTVDLAVLRLDRALSRLELRMEPLLSRAASTSTDLFSNDRDQLATELDVAKAREVQLVVAGMVASQALGQAIAKIETVLGMDTGPDATNLEEESWASDFLIGPEFQNDGRD